MTPDPCRRCNGSGTVSDAALAVRCPTCQGDGTLTYCRACHGRLIGTDVPHGVCGDCRTSTLRNYERNRT